MDHSTWQARLAKCGALMGETGIDALLLTKPANMFYLTGDGRLCAYAMITRQGKVALGVPSTDVEDVRRLAHFDHIAGFEDEVGMIHSIAHHFQHFGIRQGVVGLEYTFLTQSMMGMLTHPHAKPQEVTTKDCTHILSELRMVKEEAEIERIREAARVAAAGMADEVRSSAITLPRALSARPICVTCSLALGTPTWPTNCSTGRAIPPGFIRSRWARRRSGSAGMASSPMALSRTKA